MHVERGREKYASNENPFHGQIPGLVDQAVKGRADKAQRAKKSLMTGVTTDPYYDSTFLVFEAIQKYVISEKNPKSVLDAILLCDDLLKASTASLALTEAKDLRVSPRTIAAADRVSANNARIQKYRNLQTLIQQNIPKGYSSMLKCADFIKASPTGVHIEIRTPSSELSDQDKVKQQAELHLLAEWHNSLIADSSKKITDSGFNPKERDDFVDILKAEPKLKIYPREILIKRHLAGLSIEDIEKMSYSPSAEALDRITDYIVGIYSTPMTSRDRSIVESLFFRPIFFKAELQQAVHYKNFNLLANINLWQEMFVQALIQAHNPRSEEQLKIILPKMSESALGFTLYIANQFAAYPLEHDPLVREDNATERRAYHPLLSQALREFSQANPDATFAYSDEIGMQYFQKVVLPQLQQRLVYFGVGERFQNVVTTVKKAVEQRPFSEIHFSALQQYFTEHCGKDFLDRLRLHSRDIRSITKSVWQSTLEKLHFLPMHQGFNLIEFSAGSLPDILGIKSVLLNTSGPLQDWEENVSFELQGTNIKINGKFDQEGKLKLKADLENRIPGLFILLNHIAALAFHDLVTQYGQEKEKTTPKGQHDASTKDRQPKSDMPKDTSHGGNLPRRQSDAQLISDVYKETQQTPRRVELHKRRLPGNDTYLQSIKTYEESRQKYEEAVDLRRIEEEITQAISALGAAANELKVAREQARKASEAKIGNLPARFQLGNIHDPITNETRYFETWVIEHTSPKPTEEELRSPVKLFERYYKNSSALSSLDQLKPWIVGE